MAKAHQNEDLVIGGQTVAPGERKRIEIPVGRLPTQTFLPLTIVAVNGRRPGPRLWLSAAIHGDEINGVEIIREVLEEIDTKRLCGSVVAVPVVNVFGFLYQSRYLPDRRDLNRSFPGSPKGSLASRLAHLFMKEVVAGSDYGIDYHTASMERTNLPQIRADLSDEKTLRLARAFAAPVALHAKLRSGSLRCSATELGIPVLLYEAGETGRFHRKPVATGVRGTFRVMAELGMLSGKKPPKPEDILVLQRSQWIRSPRGGVMRLSVRVGDRVRDGQVVGLITDMLGEDPKKIVSHADGIVIGATLQPLVNLGEGILHIGLMKPASAEA